MDVRLEGNIVMSLLKLSFSACIGGLIFYVCNLPLTWLLGPMIATVIFCKVTKQYPKLPFSFRNIGLISIGYSIGITFTKDTFNEMASHLPSMIAMTVAMIAFSIILAFITTKITRTNYKSTITGSIPGGLTQMTALCAELKGVDLAVVTIIQVTRIISVVMLVPFLVYSPLLHGKEHAGGVIVQQANPFHWTILLYLLFAFIAAKVVEKCKFPTPFLIGPMVVIAALVLGGIHVPTVPVSIISISQILIGIDLGLRVKLGTIENKAVFSTVAIVSSLLLVAFSLLLSIILINLDDNISIITAFIGLAPGGIAEMAVLGQAVNEELTIITTYQLFRLLFILFCVPPLMKWTFHLLDKKEEMRMLVLKNSK
ncbi:AbrB family transcriptional regulator [Niallia sp. 01092]|uniref:AbrB family transcriptional regulator n=1 Tax=unclassified Niallia TaxID=2837522 RepID=UPI003FD26C80